MAALKLPLASVVVVPDKVTAEPAKVAVIAESAVSVIWLDADGHGLVVPPQLVAVKSPPACALQPVNVAPNEALQRTAAAAVHFARNQHALCGSRGC